jgi:hypothetical protein
MIQIKLIPIVLGLSGMSLLLQAGHAQSLSPEQPAPEVMAETAGVTLPRSPWHLVNLHWQLTAETQDFQRLDIDVTIDRDIPSTYNLYVAPIGIAKINGLQFYGGLQSNINGWETKESRTRVHPGKGAIFSRWSSDQKTPIGLKHVRKHDDGLCESAGYEGEFCSVRRPYDWTAGSYTYSIVKDDVEIIDGKPNTWFKCEVKSHASDETTDIGSLRFEGETFSYWSYHSAFVEVYSTAKIPRSHIPKVNVTFGHPRLNGKKPALKAAFATYPTTGTAAGPPCAKVSAKGDEITVEVGEIFKREGKDQRDMLKLGE